jgi:hypothetical protein
MLGSAADRPTGGLQASFTLRIVGLVPVKLSYNQQTAVSLQQSA